MQLHAAQMALDDDSRAFIPLHRLSCLYNGFWPPTPAPSADSVTTHYHEESV